MTMNLPSSHKKKKKKFKDDGRSIANMNVEGMPWFSRRPKDKKNDRKTLKNDEQAAIDPPLTKKETRNLMISSVIAALVIGLIFLTAIFLFILFSLHVWLR
jgi:hypothetical protein